MRLSQWEARLGREIEAAENRVFVWGTFDCILFPADCAIAMTGRDPAEAWRGTYSDDAGARALIDRLGGIDRCPPAAGLAEISNPMMARRGDAVLVSIAGNQSLGIVDLSGERVAVAGFKGLMRAPLHRFPPLKAWKI